MERNCIKKLLGLENGRSAAHAFSDQSKRRSDGTVIARSREVTNDARLSTGYGDAAIQGIAGRPLPRISSAHPRNNPRFRPNRIDALMIGVGCVTQA
jgi:hypothetical protein